MEDKKTENMSNTVALLSIFTVTNKVDKKKKTSMTEIHKEAQLSLSISTAPDDANIYFI